MPSTQVALSAGTVAVVPLDAPTGRIVVTMEANPAETYVTADGNVPVIPGSAEVADTQIAVSAVVGDQKVTQPPLFGDHMQIPTVRLISSGTPTVLVAW